jgi:UDP-N-acetylmuramyl pentapeptide phosphotransferase/UDP-N-acetylglucosamine-1-phosphate transferase
VSGNVVILSMLAVLVASFAVCAALILTQRWHGALSLDHDLTGAQKIHHNPVPRVGGIGVMVGLLAGVLVGYTHGGSTWPVVIKLLACAIPVFAAGLLEDLTKRVSVKTRLLASFASAALAAWTLDATLIRLDFPGVDDLMTWGPVALLFTCFAVAGMTNAINIIDGLNGLASGAVGLMLAGLAGIAWQVGDILVLKMCLWGMAALGGFLALNYPFGRIFLGDGGAYLAGFWLAECAVMLLHRNPSVSTWAVLLCVMYPTWETLYSMYRRHIKQKVSSGLPDMVHFHHLIFKAAARSLGPQARVWLRHGAASAFLWFIVACCQIGAVLGWRQHGVALVFILGFVGLYVGLYSTFIRRNEDHLVPVGLSI